MPTSENCKAEKILNEVLGSFACDGMTFESDTIELLRRYLNGEITGDDVLNVLHSKHGIVRNEC